jgi:hypothetical protein
MKKIILAVVVLSFFIPLVAGAQDNDSTSDRPVKRRHHKWYRFFEFTRHPEIALNGGWTSLNLKDLSLPFASPGFAEVEVGHSRTDDAGFGHGIVSHEFSYISLASISTDLRGKSTGMEINTSLWRAGLGWTKGYGYQLGGDASLLLLHEGGINWSQLDVRDKRIGLNPGPDQASRVIIDAADDSLLMPFDGTIRFGTKTGAAIVVKPAEMLGVKIGYERQIVFPAVMFWKWAGSAIIEVAAQEAFDRFVKQILESSPAAAPVVGFVLKNGFSYALYELRKDRMNYPFDTAPPLRADSFTLGLSFTF